MKRYLIFLAAVSVFVSLLFGAGDEDRELSGGSVLSAPVVDPNPVVINPTIVIRPTIVEVYPPVFKRELSKISIVDLQPLFTLPDVLYQERFQTSPVNGWFIFGGVWNLTNEFLRGFNYNDVTFAYYKNENFRNAYYSCLLHYLDGSCPAGMVFRMNVTGTSSYYVSGYAVGLWPSQGYLHWVFGKWINNNWINLSGWRTSNIPNQEWNSISVRAYNNQFQIKINNLLVGVFPDSSFAFGKIGVWKEKETGSVYTGYDNVTITELETTPTPHTTPTKQPTPTPAPPATPTPQPTVCYPVVEAGPVYQNGFINNDLPANEVVEFPGTFAGLQPASTSVTSVIPDAAPGQGGEGNAVRISVSPGQGTLLVLGTGAPAAADGLVLVRVDVWASNDGANLFLGLIDTNNAGDLGAGGGSLGLEQHMTSTLYNGQWGILRAFHQSTTGYVRPIIQVVGGASPCDVYIDNIAVYNIPAGLGISDALLW
ncbi:MAG: hypothetical protein ACE15F_20140 [bacterium]